MAPNKDPKPKLKGAKSEKLNQERARHQEKIRTAKINKSKADKTKEDVRTKLEKAKKEIETNPAKKAEYDQWAAEMEQLADEGRKLDAEIDEGNARLQELEKMDIDTEQAELEPQPAQTGLKSQPIQSDTETAPPRYSTRSAVAAQASSDPEDLMTSDEIKEALGSSSDEQIVAWRKVGFGTHVIVQSGPSNASKFEMKRNSEVIDELDPDTQPNISDQNSRNGDKRDQDGKYMFKRSHIVAIQGVAWKRIFGVSDMEPKSKDNKDRFTMTYVKVKWNVEGALSKTWEPRVNIRRLWGNKKETADQVIFLAAKHQEERFEQWRNKERPAKNVSPTPEPTIQNMRSESAQPVAIMPTIKEEPTDKSLGRITFETDFYALRGLEPGDQLTPDQKAEMEREWENEQKSKGGAGPKSSGGVAPPDGFANAWCRKHRTSRAALTETEQIAMKDDYQVMLKKRTDS